MSEKPPPDEEKSGLGLSDVGHTTLDILGLVPVVGEAADVTNAAWHAAEGHYLDAGLSLISVVPLIGDVIGKGGKLAGKLGAKVPGKAVDVLATLDIGAMLRAYEKHPGIGPHARKIADALEHWRADLLEKFPKITPVGKPTACAADLARQAKAEEIFAKAAAAEKRVTPDLAKLAEQNGMKMEGLDFRLKAKDSLARKLADPAGGEINDALRYTMVAPPGELAGTAAKTLTRLEEQGYKVVKVKNTFKAGAPYKGVNTQVVAPNGQIFELQFHTPQSFDVKQNVTHGLYERFRVLPDGNPEKAAIGQQMRASAAQVADPPGLADALGRFGK